GGGGGGGSGAGGGGGGGGSGGGLPPHATAPSTSTALRPTAIRYRQAAFMVRSPAFSVPRLPPRSRGPGSRRRLGRHHH
ncbi:MAG: hypothetical protein F4W89_17490, partial [Acidobacteria bacterium]|nr:hypothetical protein [Acidobacteriota bacterium]